MNSRQKKSAAPARDVNVSKPEERALMNDFNEKEKSKNSRLKVSSGNTIGFDHNDQEIGKQLFMDAIAAQDSDFATTFIRQLANAACIGPKITENEVNFFLSVIKGIEPRDQVEAMLGAQMAAVHTACMTFTRRLNHAENIPQQDSAEKTLNKLMRTFTSQMEALRKHRCGGEQKVTVQYVNVNEGGQAVVGNIKTAKHERTGGGNKN